MDWRDLQTFLATAEAGSTQAASEGLGLDQSTISRRIAAFEKSLGHRLFERLPTGLVLTTAGERMLETAQQVDLDVHALERCLVGQDMDVNGEVRLTVPPLMLESFLHEILAEFHEAHPDVHLDIDVSFTEANLTKREADIAVRGSNTPPEHLIGRQPSAFHLAMYSAREKQALGFDQPWIGWGEADEMEAWARERDIPVAGRLWRVDELRGQMALTKAGLGIAALPCLVADQDPNLVRLQENRTWLGREIWVLTHKDLLASPRIRTVFNFLADAIAARKNQLEGVLPSPPSR